MKKKYILLQIRLYEENPHKNLRSELEPFLADDRGISQEFFPKFRSEQQMNSKTKTYIGFLLGARAYVAYDRGILKSRVFNKLLHNNPDKSLNQRRLYKNSDRKSGQKIR